MKNHKELPCPHCGSVEAYTEESDASANAMEECGYQFVVKCHCGATMFSPWCESPDDARKSAMCLWNTRYERTCRITDEEPIEIPDGDPWYGMLGTGITRYKLSCGHDTLSADCDGPKRCCECGAKVVSE